MASTKKDTAALPDGFGERVRYARELADPPLSGSELADLAGVSRGLVSAIELGDRDNPTRETLTGLRRTLGVELTWLLDGEGPLPLAADVEAAVAAARERVAKVA